LLGESLQAVYSSDLQRARTTAEAIAQAQQLTLSLEPGLRERHFGHLEGLTHQEITARWPEQARRWRERDPAFGPDGGETLQAFYDRVVGTLAGLARRPPGGCIAVVAHGGVLDCFYRAANRLPLESRGAASGVINAGGSFGQFVFAPLSQWLIAGFGWVTALFGLAAVTLLTIPLAWPLRHKAEHPEGGAAVSGGMGEQLRVAFGDRSYWCLHAGFLTCGFHIAFLATHLPGAVDLCGLPGSVSANSLALIGLANIVGGLAAGWACQRYRMKWLLFGMYASRAVMVGLYLVAPKTDLTFYLFAFGLGLTWLATVPPTAGLVGKLFGLRYLGTLFGLTLLSHQIGAFFGAWLGGLALVEFGNYDSMWIADIVLASLAALINVPIREASPAATATACAMIR